MSTSLAPQIVPANTNGPLMGITSSPRQVPMAHASHAKMTSCDSHIVRKLGPRLPFIQPCILPTLSAVRLPLLEFFVHSLHPRSCLVTTLHPINAWPGHIASIHNTHAALGPTSPGATRGGGVVALSSCRVGIPRRPIGAALGSAVQPGVERASRTSLWMVAVAGSKQPPAWRQTFGVGTSPSGQKCSSTHLALPGCPKPQPGDIPIVRLLLVALEAAITFVFWALPNRKTHCGLPDMSLLPYPMGDHDTQPAGVARVHTAPARCCRRGFGNRLALNSLKR